MREEESGPSKNNKWKHQEVVLFCFVLTYPKKMLNSMVVRYQKQANAVANEKASCKMHHKKKIYRDFEHLLSNKNLTREIQSMLII